MWRAIRGWDCKSYNGPQVSQLVALLGVNKNSSRFKDMKAKKTLFPAQEGKFKKEFAADSIVWAVE